MNKAVTQSSTKQSNLQGGIDLLLLLSAASVDLDYIS